MDPLNSWQSTIILLGFIYIYGRPWNVFEFSKYELINFECFLNLEEELHSIAVISVLGMNSNLHVPFNWVAKILQRCKVEILWQVNRNALG